MNIDELFEDVNVIGTAALSEYLDLPRVDICRWAADNGVAMIGTSYAFTLPEAEDLVRDLVDEEDADQEEDCEEENGDEEEGDEEESDDDNEDEDEDDEDDDDGE